MNERFNHFKNYEWVGYFWYPDESLKLHGKLIYNPKDRIQLGHVSAATAGFAVPPDYVF